MNVLLTFTGFHDPYSPGLVGQEEQSGPIVSLVGEKYFDKIVLFSTPNTEKNTAATEAALHTLHIGLTVEVRHLPLDDPTDYSGILKSLRTAFGEINEQSVGANYFISVTSGTPQMHACWVLLAASGEIPARILNVRPTRFISKDRPLISEMDLASNDLPMVRPNLYASEDQGTTTAEFSTAVQELGIIGDHPAMRHSLETGATLAGTNFPILILGETGTGKELFARFIHYLSGRPRENFIPLNCAAIPAELAESILFGHKRGAFTGATSDQKGKFDEADGGTLFLDELGELPLQAQSKLLRVLQDGVVEPLGARRPHKVDVRTIAATNQNISNAIRQGKFREDLYYRLNVGEIVLPPLRERRSDIPKIALHVLDRINRNLRKQKRFSQHALSRLQRHNWKGNVRDLENTIERSLLLCRKDVVDADDLLISEPTASRDPLSSLPEPHPDFSMDEYLSSARKQMILRALEIARNNQSEAARLLGISPQAVSKFLRER